MDPRRKGLIASAMSGGRLPQQSTSMEALYTVSTSPWSAADSVRHAGAGPSGPVLAVRKAPETILGMSKARSIKASRVSSRSADVVKPHLARLAFAWAVIPRGRGLRTSG